MQECILNDFMIISSKVGKWVGFIVAGVCGIRSTVYGLRYTVYGVRSTVYGVRSTGCGLRYRG